MMRLPGDVARTYVITVTCGILVRKPQGMRPLGNPRSRWEENIKMNLRDKGLSDMDWIDLSSGRDNCKAFANTAMNFRAQ
jgi:hypothetical protein